MIRGVSDKFFELMEKSCETGKMGWYEDLIGQVLKFDDDTMQDMMKKLRSGIQVSTETDPELALEGSNTGTQASNEGSARRGGAQDRTTTEAGGNNERERATEASQGGERDETTN